MKDFNEFYNDDGSNPDIDASPMDIDDEISEAMWQFIASLDDAILETLTDDQLADYVEIIEAVADQPDDVETVDPVDIAEADLEEGKLPKNLKGLKIRDKTDSFKLGKVIGDEGKAFVRIRMSNGDTTDVKRVDAELMEAMPKKRVRRDILQKRKASREHRKVKAKRKIQGRRKRKTAKFKRFKKKAKRLGKRGLTSTGKRKRTFINKG